MLYLNASEQIEILDNFNGEKGRFLKTFAFNTERNKNGWRVTWDSIKKNISDFINNPGIEFEKCEDSVCDLDHTEGSTYEQSLDIQEDFRVTDIVDYVLDENTETAFAIHKLKEGKDDFWEKVQQRIIKAVSPSIWPIPGRFTINGINEKGLPIIDAFDWKALHIAFLTKNPAYGDVATITSTCEGENCHMKLLSAKELTANADLAPLQEISLLVKHKDKLRFVGVSKDVADKINARMKAGEIVNEELLKDVMNSSESKTNTSFSSCGCSSKSSMTLSEEETKKLQESAKASEDKIKELESKLKASEDEREKLDAKLKAAEEDEPEKVKEAKKAQEEAEKAKHAVEEENKDLKAKIVEPMIQSILKAREERGMPQEMLSKLKTSLSAKSIDEIEEKFNEDKFTMTSFTASENQGVHFDFGDSSNGPLSAKSLESVFDGEES